MKEKSFIALKPGPIINLVKNTAAYYTNGLVLARKSEAYPNVTFSVPYLPDELGL
jgi:hypothetical protein